MAAWLEPAHVRERHGEADRSVPAHAEIARIVEENYAGGAGRVVRLAEERANHCLMTVGLGHGEAAQMIKFASEALAPLGHRPIAKRRAAIDDHPRGLALGVGVDDPQRLSPSRRARRPTRRGTS